MKPITQLWTGVFAIPDGHRLYRGTPAETILIGTLGDEIRATVEHEPNALLALISMCRNIERKDGLAFRLLHFENPREVSQEEMQGWLDLTARCERVH